MTDERQKNLLSQTWKLQSIYAQKVTARMNLNVLLQVIPSQSGEPLQLLTKLDALVLEMIGMEASNIVTDEYHTRRAFRFEKFLRIRLFR